jgi:hypothetical protein
MDTGNKTYLGYGLLNVNEGVWFLHKHLTFQQKHATRSSALKLRRFGADHLRWQLQRAGRRNILREVRSDFQKYRKTDIFLA